MRKEKTDAFDGLLDSNVDWYSNDYILSLNPEMFKETVPVYRGSDGNIQTAGSKDAKMSRISRLIWKKQTRWSNVKRGFLRTKRGLIDQKKEGVCTSFTSNVHQDFTSQYITIHGNAAIIKKEGVYVRTNSFIDSMSGFVFFNFCYYQKL